MSKGDTPRNIGSKFQENFPNVNWKRSGDKLPDRVTSTKQVFVYGPSTHPGRLVLVDLCPNPNCVNGGVDTGGVTPWGSGITDRCEVCGGTGFGEPFTPKLRSKPTEKDQEFEKKLAALINYHSQENASNTPDFILACYMTRCLEAFNEAVQRRETWYGRVSATATSAPSEAP